MVTATSKSEVFCMEGWRARKDGVSFMQQMSKEEACEKLHEVIVQITENLPILGQGEIKAFLDACLPAIYQIEELNDHFVSDYALLVEECKKEDPIAYVVYFSLSDRYTDEIFIRQWEFAEWLETSDMGRAIREYRTLYHKLTLEEISEIMQRFPK